MGLQRERIGQFRQIFRLLLTEKDYCLLPFLYCIDPAHYLAERSGDELRHGRDPHPLFDCRFYRETYLEQSYSHHPFYHYMTRGYRHRFRPSPFFDYDIYAQNSGWSPKQGNPLKHYLTSRANRLISTGIFFDADWYLDNTPSLRATAGDLLIDYKIKVPFERKSPIPVFSAPDYLNSVGQAAEAVRDPLAHYVTYGIPVDIPPSRWFDPIFYRENYLQEGTPLSPLEHYLREGVFQGNYPLREVAELPDRPVISIIVPVYNANPSFLANCIRSVLYQTYPHWELCMVDDGSTNMLSLRQLERFKEIDPRIKIVFSDQNRGISDTSNTGVELATGDYLGFLDNDDTLEPDCLYQVARVIGETGADIVYTDEDLIDDDGNRLVLMPKPGYNPGLLLAHNYITHFVAVAAPLFDACGGFRKEHDGAQDFDLILRLSELTGKIVHIPRVLYHWRAHESSTSLNPDQKQYAQEAGRSALELYLNRKGIEAEVEETERNFFYRVRPHLAKEPRVTVLIHHDSHQPVVTDFDLVAVTARYTNCEFILVTDNEQGIDQLPPDFDILLVPEGSSRARALHLAASAKGGDFLAFLDTTIATTAQGWLQELVGVSVQLGAEIVASRVDCVSGDIPRYSVPETGNLDPAYYLEFLQHWTIHRNGLHNLQHIRTPCWNTGLIRRQRYFDLGGFASEHYPHLFAMADLGFLAADQGLPILYTPYARATAKRSGPCAVRREDLEEQRRFQQRWRHRLLKPEPWYSYTILEENGITLEDFSRWLTGEEGTP